MTAHLHDRGSCPLCDARRRAARRRARWQRAWQGDLAPWFIVVAVVAVLAFLEGLLR